MRNGHEGKSRLGFRPSFARPVGSIGCSRVILNDGGLLATFGDEFLYSHLGCILIEKRWFLTAGGDGHL
jgi:hypothetical protein